MGPFDPTEALSPFSELVFLPFRLKLDIHRRRGILFSGEGNNFFILIKSVTDDSLNFDAGGPEPN